jgi:DNA-binding response OmpR family regulator
MTHSDTKEVHMAPARKKAAKKRASRRSTSRGMLLNALKPELLLELVAWESYEDPKFFERLIENRNSREKLNAITMEKLNPGTAKQRKADGTMVHLEEKELDLLQALLQSKMVIVDFPKIMKGLHTYTLPKPTARQKILGTMALGFRPWAPWDPIIQTEAAGQVQKDAPPKL